MRKRVGSGDILRKARLSGRQSRIAGRQNSSVAPPELKPERDNLSLLPTAVSGLDATSASPLLVLLAVLLLGGGCSRPPVPSAADSPTAGAADSASSASDASVKPQFSFIYTGDVRARPQLLSGWYAIEDSAWRWMAKEAQAVLLTPQESPVNFELRLVFPEEHMKRAGGPVTVSVLLGGVLFAQQTYPKPGAYIIHRTVPAGSLPRPSTRITIRLDRSIPPTGADKRELGAVIQGFGFVK